uniref:uncharacterized protein zgc:113531 isoform X2 n=1 Tax=Doryrhamphus excisus TaxID=161450 RepID=UPI0025ADE398|nr:uncharacterized protein zgc:113531 isoform X2 [Doryrhamphus excisus]
MAMLLLFLSLVLCTKEAAFGFSVAGQQQQENTCEANGSIYYVGEWYFLDSDQCTQCECTPEGSACARTDCTSLPAACIHVSHYPTDCCPRCERIGCEYRGVVYELGENFREHFKHQTTSNNKIRFYKLQVWHHGLLNASSARVTVMASPGVWLQTVPLPPVSTLCTSQESAALSARRVQTATWTHLTAR